MFFLSSISKGQLSNNAIPLPSPALNATVQLQSTNYVNYYSLLADSTNEMINCSDIANHSHLIQIKMYDSIANNWLAIDSATSFSAGPGYGYLALSNLIIGKKYLLEVIVDSVGSSYNIQVKNYMPSILQPLACNTLCQLIPNNIFNTTSFTPTFTAVTNTTSAAWGPWNFPFSSVINTTTPNNNIINCWENASGSPQVFPTPTDINGFAPPFANATFLAYEGRLNITLPTPGLTRVSESVITSSMQSAPGNTPNPAGSLLDRKTYLISYWMKQYNGEVTNYGPMPAAPNMVVRLLDALPLPGGAITNVPNSSLNYPTFGSPAVPQQVISTSVPTQVWQHVSRCFTIPNGFHQGLTTDFIHIMADGALPTLSQPKVISGFYFTEPDLRIWPFDNSTELIQNCGAPNINMQFTDCPFTGLSHYEWTLPDNTIITTPPGTTNLTATMYGIYTVRPVYANLPTTLCTFHSFNVQQLPNSPNILLPGFYSNTATDCNNHIDFTITPTVPNQTYQIVFVENTTLLTTTSPIFNGIISNPLLIPINTPTFTFQGQSSHGGIAYLIIKKANNECSVLTMIIEPCCAYGIANAHTPFPALLKNVTSSYITALNAGANTPNMLGGATGGDVIIDGTFIIDNDFIIGGSIIRLTKNSSIKFKSGVAATLTINKSHLLACNDFLWEGIILTAPNHRLIINDCLIEDANIAVNATGNAKIHAGKTVFNKNYIGIRTDMNGTPVGWCNWGAWGFTIADTCLFLCHSGVPFGQNFALIANIISNITNHTTLLKRYTNTTVLQRSLKGIELNHVGTTGNPLKVFSSTPQNTFLYYNKFANLDIGIDAVNSNAIIYHAYFSNITEDKTMYTSLGSLSKFEGAAINISNASGNTANTVQVHGLSLGIYNNINTDNYFVDCKYGVKAINHNFEVQKSTFLPPINYPYYNTLANQVNTFQAISFANQNNRNVYISQNQIFGWYTAISGNLNQGSKIIIVNNTISNNAITNSGIELFETATATNNKHTVANNTITNAKTGIWYSNIFSIGQYADMIKSNKIFYNTASTTGICTGIGISLGKNIDVDCNLVENVTNTFLPVWGIALGKTIFNSIYNNTLYRNSTGIVASDNCLTTYLLMNYFNTNLTGIRLMNKGEIGKQGLNTPPMGSTSYSKCPLNNWGNTFTLPTVSNALASFVPSLFENFQKAKFYVNSGAIPPYDVCTANTSKCVGPNIQQTLSFNNTTSGISNPINGNCLPTLVYNSPANMALKIPEDNREAIYDTLTTKTMIT
jgi:hypothetical protein